jgi:2-keto-4-pentenoate hydratase
MSMSPLAAQIAQARRSRTPFAFEPALAVPDMAAAYRAQADVATVLGAKVAGWKVGFAPDGGAPWAAPILDCDMRESGGDHVLPPGASVKIEAELGVRFGRDLPVRAAPYNRDDILDAITEMFVGIELIVSRFANVTEADFVSKVADSFSNGAYAVGAGTAVFGSLDLSQLRCRLVVNGTVCNDRLGGHSDGDPLIPLVAWANAQADQLGGLRAGQFLTLGTLNEPVPMDRAARIESSLEGIGEASLRLV